MMTKQKKHERGDTLVEVLLVTAILSFIVVGANLLMNRAFAGTQEALELTVVRQAIEGQVEMLTFARDKAISDPASPTANVWRSNILAAADTSVTPYGECLSGSDSSRFFLQMNGANLVYDTNPQRATGIALPGRGIWVEAYRPSSADSYVDFHVYGCWESPTTNPDLTTGTVVRLYVP